MTKRTATRTKPDYLDTALNFEQRVDDLVSRMTLKDKVSQIIHDAPEIRRLGIAGYNWWNECLHGVGRAGFATMFPQAIGMAATWNRALIGQIATAISDEARAKHEESKRLKSDPQYYGLDFWAPNVNIFRDPRWGRGHETYGEDPYLTGEIGLHFVKGLQGDDPTYLKTIATPKHFAVHSGPESTRDAFDATVSKRDLEETYLPQFRTCVVDGKAQSVMGAYNRINGEACCASPTLLQRILRNKWGFDGYVVSDCGGIDNIHKYHKLAADAAHAAALAVKSGCDLNCGETYPALIGAVSKGIITELEIDVAVRRVFMARMKLGMFDPPERCRFTKIPMSVVGSRKHRALALKAARESIVLLRNEKSLLPLDPRKLRTVAVVGPAANEYLCLAGNYHGTPTRPVTPLAAIMKKLPKSTRVLFEPGCDFRGYSGETMHEVRYIAKEADVVIACVGLSPALENEGLDRTDLSLNKEQRHVLKAVAQAGKPIVLVLLNGSAVTFDLPEVKIAAVIEAWYPGEEGGTAIADVLFGDYNPGGRLPVTFYQSVDQLPAFDDYSMRGRTYRYFDGEPLFPFGFGLSYTRFSYTGLRVQPERPTTSGTIKIAVDVKNSGDMDGDEVVQVYVRPSNPSIPAPRYQLCQFARVHIRKGQVRTIKLAMPARAFSIVNENGVRTVAPGAFDLFVGGSLPSARGAVCVRARIRLSGDTVKMPGAF